MANFSAAEDAIYRELLALERRYSWRVKRILAAAFADIQADLKTIEETYAKERKLLKEEAQDYTRLRTAETILRKRLDPAITESTRLLRRLAPTIYREAYWSYTREIRKALRLKVAWGLPSERAILRAVADPYLKISLDRYRQKARSVVRDALTKGIARGKGYADIAPDIRVGLETTYKRALRIARTEGQMAMNAGQNDAYAVAAANGVEMEYFWDATLDFRTRPSHGIMDQQMRGPDGRFNGPGPYRAPYPGWVELPAAERIACRCRLRGNPKGFTPLLRRTREGGIVRYMTFEEWQAGQAKGGKKDAAKKG